MKQAFRLPGLPSLSAWNASGRKLESLRLRGWSSPWNHRQALQQAAEKPIVMSHRRPIEGTSGRGPRFSKGFTLLELMTALAVSLIILVTLMESLTQASRSWTGQSKNFSEQRESRAGLRILAEDIAMCAAIGYGCSIRLDSETAEELLRIR